jgi:Thiol:disulfide interchange protein DsbD, N-terminal
LIATYKRTTGAVIAFLILSAVSSGQMFSPIAQSRPLVKSNAVQYLFPEQVTVTAGKPSQVVLHFRVAQGLHINSHNPKDEFLIPTTFTIADGTNVRLDAASYPAGTITSLAFDPKTKLSVYTGDFTIQARIVAARGNHLMQGKLRYQACDNNQCMPPKTIDVPVDVIGK